MLQRSGFCGSFHSAAARHATPRSNPRMLRSPRPLASLIGMVAAALLLVAAPSVRAFAIYKVGINDPNCQFSDIQAAIDAAANNPGEDYIWIAGASVTWAQTHLVISDQDVIIEGGFTDCSQDEPTGQSRLQGMNGRSVIEIEGNSHVELTNLEILGASMDSSHSGGGIYFGGAGSLTLEATWVHDNQTGYGGGIDMSPSGASALDLLEGTTVSGNTALVSGGGIRVEGATVLTSSSGPNQSPIYIAQNSALGQGDTAYGGGIEVIGPAVANVASVVDLNVAEYGGGIAAVSNGNGSPTVFLYATDPMTPPTIYGNQASRTGGGIYLLPDIGVLTGDDAFLCANDFVIDANVAQEGAAIYSDEGHGDLGDYTGGVTSFNDNGYCTQASQVPGGVACAAGIACDEINDNIDADANGLLTAGAAILLQTGSTLNGGRLRMQGNQGGSLIHALSDQDTLVYMTSCLLTGNTMSNELISFTPGGGGGALGQFDHCTIADNAIGAPFVMLAELNQFSLANSIVDQPGNSTLDYSGSGDGYSVSYVLSTEIATLTGPGLLAGEPTFVDRANGDYHLVPVSTGVDYAPAADGTDLDGHPRTIDLPDVPNGFGPLDLGAYEIQSDDGGGACAAQDTVFCNGFDGG
jgi:predicted outer membrane repeat protein